MASLQKKKLTVSKKMIFGGDELYWLLVFIAVIFGVLVINKERIFKYTVNAHQLCYEEQHELVFKGASLSCANVVETIEKIIFIPEKNVETQKVSRYLMVIQYAVTNNSNEDQTIQVLHAGENGVQINGKKHSIEEAKYLELDRHISGEEEWIETIPANTTVQNLYYALWIYSDYSKNDYYSCDLIGKGDRIGTVIGIRNGQVEEGATLDVMIP